MNQTNKRKCCICWKLTSTLEDLDYVLYMLETHVHTRRSRLCVVYAGNSIMSTLEDLDYAKVLALISSKYSDIQEETTRLNLEPVCRSSIFITKLIHCTSNHIFSRWCWHNSWIPQSFRTCPFLWIIHI